MRSFLDDSIAEHHSKPPLRWVANWAGNVASKAVLRSAFLEEDDKIDTIMYKINFHIWDKLWPIYEKYGTFYKVSWDMSGKQWDDYDDNGVPYWEKLGVVDPDYYPWDFEDEETGDAFRIVR